MIISIVLLLISFGYIIYYKTFKSLHMLQQNLYNENNRYLKWVNKNSNQFISIEIICLVVSLIGLLLLNNNTWLSIISMIVMSVILLITGYSWKNNIKNDQNKKKLVVTKRIKRLLVTIILLYLIPIIIVLTDNKQLWLGIFILNVLTYLNALVVFLGMIINTPIERLVYNYYKKKAQNKLKSMPNLKIIGITGSYGKTSCKNILGEILNIKYNALPTPKNLNTYNGLIMTINNYMDKFTDIFIAEMGAYVKGEIAGLCRLVKPKYGILTTIGTAHLESFGSEQNIIDGKFELIESLPKDGFAILNGDDSKQVNYKLKNNVKTIWIGINNKEADVVADNIKCSSKGTNFDVKFKGESKAYHFETKLLGNHNVYNILSAIACGKEFGIDYSDLQKAVKNVQPIEHRLQLKRVGNFNMIDNAYNSNPVGAKNALKVLNTMPGKKIVVTPGMIELGDKEDEYNRAFGQQMTELVDLDYAILIGEKKTKPIKEGLLSKKFDKDRIIIFNDVREAYPFIGNIASKEKQEVFALFENDLPDIYNEK